MGKAKTKTYTLRVTLEATLSLREDIAQARQKWVRAVSQNDQRAYAVSA